MSTINLVLPHQLFKNSPLLELEGTFYLIEEYLFFKQYPFHKQKIAFHRATMKGYADYLASKGFEVIYIEAHELLADIRQLIPLLKAEGISQINCIDPTDNWISKRIEEGCKKTSISLKILDSPLFLNKKDELLPFFRSVKKKYHQTSFYIDERKRRSILIDEYDKPVGGNWTFDTENRKKFPTKQLPPPIHYPYTTLHYLEAVEYVNAHFTSHYGALDKAQMYPVNFEQTNAWLQQFFENRFAAFGIYEDAILSDHDILHHSVLTPMLNVGLITPEQIIQEAIHYAEKEAIPLNSLEGFIRQLIGWREFIRGMYESKGTDERTRNFWNFHKPIPASFYDGTTGIKPIDDTIKKILKTGYCHHIERLMIVGNFMLLCEFHPNGVYQWFMELFIDAYDWVMVPNVYGMSQFADGGLMATKPYISGSNYILKMSNYKKGEPWQAIWDGLFWRFMDKQRDFFLQNPRLSMLVRNFDKLPQEKRMAHLRFAEEYLERQS